MSSFTGAMLNTVAFGNRPETVEIPTVQPRAPTVNDVNWVFGKLWIDRVGLSSYRLVGLTSIAGVMQATWVQEGSSGTLTAGALTASNGNVTATNGNFVATSPTTGLVLTPVVVGPGASPQVANARSGTATFSGVNIAAGATQTFVITNSTVAVGSVILVTMFGATAGSALTMTAITPSAGSLSITVTNGTGATTDTANINFTFEVLN